MFKVDTVSQEIVFSFATPLSEQGGCKGLDSDGHRPLYHGLDRTQNLPNDEISQLVNTIALKEQGGGGLAYDGKCFWVPQGNHIARDHRNGNMACLIMRAPKEPGI